MQSTDASGLADFALPAGSFTLRAYVNGPGPSAFADYPVETRVGRTTRVEVLDCIVCVKAR